MRRAWMAAVALVSSFSAYAGEPDAAEIARRAAENGAPPAVRESVEMTLVDAKGASSARSLSIVRKKTKDAWNVRLEFLTPKDVAGTILLSLGKNAGASDQYLWLPGLKRVRRIGGAQKSGSFQGTDFSYEDLEVRDPALADYTKLADERITDADCFVVQAVPKKAADSGYAKTIAWIRKSDFVTLRVRFYDAKAEVKTLEVDPSKIKVDGETRVPQRLEMTTKKDGHKTTLSITALDLHPTLEDSLFDPASLDRY